MRNIQTNSLLDFACEKLGYSEVEGINLFESRDKPGSLSEDIWVEKGDWLALAHEAGAEKVFFYQNNPVIVFARLNSDNPEGTFKFYNRIWSMARPRLLFLAKPGELSVYDLAKKPPESEEEFEKLKPLEIIRSTTEVAEKLKHFQREELESGRLFNAEYRFGDLKNRADKALINDLKEIRRELIKKGLKGQNLKFAHSLIGRSIFIRYLEDRGILTQRTFLQVAGNNVKWKGFLENSPSRPGLDFTKDPSLYQRVLEDKDFTFALFRKLGEDFNGDMFPDVDGEEAVIEHAHLKLIQDLLFGYTGSQKSLFFYAYQFKIIPIDLISSIYEEFYHEEGDTGKKQGAFYTPPSLAEFVLSQTLTPSRLAKNPRIMDPACGSGIFLVESFRRIVRYRIAKQNRRLRFHELQKILRDQLRGIDINPEAIRVAAFSLYLSLLHYLRPSDIREQLERGNRLPNLMVDNNKPDSFGILLAANAFDVKALESKSFIKENFLSSCVDIVVGNPPWGSDSKKENQVAMNWCKERKYPVGDKERSQAFIWRSLDMLRHDGTAGLLVSTGVFFKHHEKSVAFRRKWLDSCRLDSVYNFAHTRKVFFRGVNSPFAAVFFHKNKENIPNYCVNYWTAKRTRFIEGIQSVVFSRNDIKILQSEDDLSNYKTWKVFWRGNHHDASLLIYLNTFPRLKNLTEPNLYGRGFEKTGDKNDPEWLNDFSELLNTRPTKRFMRYGKIDKNVLVDIPKTVNRRGNKNIYKGIRILVARGIEENCLPKGQIVARLEEQDYCFRNSIHGFKLQENCLWKYKIVIGILWSSLARYYFFSTTANWGVWHDEIHLKDELLLLPICFPKEGALKNKILTIVEQLQNYDPPVKSLTAPNGVYEDEIRTKRQKLEAELDEAIFELYGLGQAETDLIRDMCDINLDFFYLKDKSQAVKPALESNQGKKYGSLSELPQGFIGDYLRVFIQGWSAYLDEGTELRWNISLPPGGASMVAIVFSVCKIGEKPTTHPGQDSKAWNNLLCRLDKALLQPISSTIYSDGLVRAVLDSEIIIIKRNEKRLWTKSMAREDVEATLFKAMKERKQKQDMAE